MQFKQKDKSVVGIVVDNEFNNDIRLRKEVRVLSEYGYNITVLCFGFGNKKYQKIDGIKIERIRINKKLQDILFATQNRFPFYEWLWRNKIKKFIIKNNLSILHVHDLYMSKPAHLGIKSSNKNCKLILDLHENFPVAVRSYNWTKGTFRNLLTYPNLWNKKEREYLRYPSKIIVLSENFKKTLINRYLFLEKNNIVPYPNVIDFERFNKYKINHSKIKKEIPTLLYFGGVAERRGIFNTIDAIKTVIEKGYQLSLMIIGPIDKADRERFISAIDDPKIKSSIDYVPWIDVSELLTYLNICDICLAPFIKNEQHESGIANKLFQYMYGKKPIIASDCLPQKELIESNNCGLIFSTQEEFVNSIIHLIANKDLATEMGLNGHKALFQKFNPKKIDQVLIDLYESIKSNNSF